MIKQCYAFCIVLMACSSAWAGWKYSTNGVCTTAANVAQTYASQHTGSSGGFDYFFSVSTSNETNGSFGGTYYSCTSGTSSCGSPVAWTGQALTCTPTCSSAGTPYGTAAYFDYGTSASNTEALKMSCTSGSCAVIFVGSSPAGRSMVNGVFHYFAQGSYEYIGADATCTPSGTNAVLGSASSIPANTCAATETPQTFNGVVRCVVKSTGAVSENSPPVPKVGTQSTEQVLSDGKVQKVDTTTYGDGSQSTRTRTFPSAGATEPTSSETTINGGPGSYADKANPGIISGAGGGTGGTATVQFPSDYARAGEASAAAQSINDALGPKLDKIVETGTDPTDPTLPQGSEFDQAFFQGTFTNLLGWQMPAHLSQCPTSSFNYNSQTYTVDAHCQLVTNHFSVLASVMSVVWTVLALFILLGA
ncbi:MAG: hypothetical protein FD157_3512 [Rhodocyclaceae bacterium]|nr:MAG: hypothetical protein FD157_3512 [Rhodocyclaceae bacterium]TND01875.1 MAG: hypothetical protein FD118_2134 [Rhodocyclaceae bacterium]